MYYQQDRGENKIPDGRITQGNIHNSQGDIIHQNTNSNEHL